MNENELNAELMSAEQAAGEVVPPYEDDKLPNTGANGEEFAASLTGSAEIQPLSRGKGENAAPRINTNEMSDEDFDAYLKSVKDGTVDNDTANNDKAAAKNDTGHTADSDTEPDRAREEAKPFKTFQTQQDWQKTIDTIVGERLKSSRESKEQLDKIVQQAADFYGIEDSATAISQLIEDLRSQNADKSGVDVETYTKRQQDAIDAQRYREQRQAEADKSKRINDIQNRWKQESEELRKVVPGFDFTKAMENQAFYDRIVDGQSVSMAYLACNTAQKAQEKPKRRAIEQNGNSKSGGTGQVFANPETMSDADFDTYIRRIRNGG